MPLKLKFAVSMLTPHAYMEACCCARELVLLSPSPAGPLTH